MWPPLLDTDSVKAELFFTGKQGRGLRMGITLHGPIDIDYP
jgi:hypothetical protein